VPQEAAQNNTTTAQLLPNGEPSVNQMVGNDQ